MRMTRRTVSRPWMRLDRHFISIFVAVSAHGLLARWPKLVDISGGRAAIHGRDTVLRVIRITVRSVVVMLPAASY